MPVVSRLSSRAGSSALFRYVALCEMGAFSVAAAVASQEADQW